MNILVTGSGAPGSRGTVYCLKSGSQSCKIIGMDADPSKHLISKALFDEFILAPRVNDQHYAEKLLAICSDQKIDVIVPQTTREIEVLSLNKKKFSEHGVSVAVSEHEAIINSNDKLYVTNKLESLGFGESRIQEVSSKDDLQAACKKFDYPNSPVVLKAKNLNGKRGYRVLQPSTFSYEEFLLQKPQADGIDLETILATFPETFETIMVMEYFPGQEFSVDAFIGEKIAIAIPRERTSIRSGISFSNRVIKDSYLIEASLEYGRSAGLTGVFGMQFKKDTNDQFQVLECNPRIQGTMVVAALSGANIIQMQIDELLSQKFDHDYLIDWDTVFQRYWGGYGFNEKGVLEI